VSTQDSIGAGTIVTPEAVALDFRIAAIASRSLAYLIDFVIQLVAFIVLVVVGCPAAMETLNGGRTIGRMALGTRVVTVEGAPIRFRHAFIRALLSIVDHILTLGGVAIITAMLTKRGQRLGDLVAGTMVIRERTSKLQTSAVSFWRPTGYDNFINSIDTSGLGEERYRLVRDFLTRLEDLSPQHQVSLADEIAAAVQERLPMHQPPLGMTSITYLFAIIAAAQPASAQPPPPQPPGGVLPSGLPQTPSAPPPPPGSAPAPYAPTPTTPPPPGFASPAPPAAPPPSDGGFSAPG